MHRSMQRGMTLIEILVAVAIVGLLMALAAPSSMVWIQNLQLRNAAESVLTGVKQARVEALRRNTTVMFELTDPASSAWHVCIVDTLTKACKASETDLALHPASEGSPNARVGVETAFTNFSTPVAAGTGVPAQVAFDPLGRVSSLIEAIERIDVRNTKLSSSDERRLSIFIGPTGQVLMCDPALSKATNPQGCQ